MEWLATEIWQGLERVDNVPGKLSPAAREGLKAKILALKEGPRQAAVLLLLLSWHLKDGLSAPKAARSLFKLCLECDPTLNEDIPAGRPLVTQEQLKILKRGYDRFCAIAGGTVKADAPTISTLSLRLNIRG